MQLSFLGDNRQNDKLSMKRLGRLIPVLFQSLGRNGFLKSSYNSKKVPDSESNTGDNSSRQGSFLIFLQMHLENYPWQKDKPIMLSTI